MDDRHGSAIFGRAADLDGLEWMRARDLAPFVAHTHETFSIGIVRRGANIFRRGRARVVAEAGAICLVNPGDVHTGGEGGACEGLWNFYPSEEHVRRAVDGAAPRFLRPVATDPEIIGAAAALFEALEHPASLLERETALLTALAVLFARHAEPSSAPSRAGVEPRAVRLVREYLHAHATDNVSLASLAAIAALSQYHLVRVFGASVGMPPHAYQVMLRLERAKASIARGASIASVAAECGFADQAHLTRRFRRVFGVTPGAVARASRADRKNVQDRIGRRP